MRLYSARGTDGSDVRRTEDSLREMAEEPNSMDRHNCDGKLLGTWNPTQDEVAVKTIEQHGKIKRLGLQKDDASSSPGAQLCDALPVEGGGVQEKEKNPSLEEDSLEATSPPVRELASHDVELYNVMAARGSDSKGTEAFLRSKVENADEIRQHTWGNTVTGWWNLSMDVSARREVEEHEGVENVELLKDINWFKEDTRPGIQMHCMMLWFW